jgi:hypothetical protein
MVNNRSHKKGGGFLDMFSKKETKEECVAKCDKKFSVATPSTVPNTPSTGTPSTGTPSTVTPSTGVTTPDANNKGWMPSWLSFGKKQQGGKRRSKGSKKTRKNKKRKGTRKSSL